MGNRRSQIISSGINYTNLSTIGFIPKVQSLLPPTVNNSIMQQLQDGAVDYIRVGPTAVTAAAAVEAFRTAEGIISEGRVGGVGAVVPESVVIGEGARVGTNNNIAIGFGASAVGGAQGSIAIGRVASGTAGQSLVIGNGASTVGLNGGGGGLDVTAIGTNAQARASDGQSAIAIGNGAIAGREGIAIGRAAFTSDVSQGGAGRDGGMAIGHASTTGDANSTKNTIIGHGSGVTAAATSWNTIVGRTLQTSAGATIMIGAQVDNSQRVEASGAAIIIGLWTGNGTISGGANRCLIGGNAAGTDIRTMIVGGGDTAITPAAKLFRWTDGSGANNAAGAVTFRAPLSTGNAASAPFIIQVGQQVAGSSSVLQTPGAAATFSHTTAGGHLATFGGGIATADPGAGVGIWRLGQVQAAAVVLDATQYAEVMIDGAVVRLGIVV